MKKTDWRTCRAHGVQGNNTIAHATMPARRLRSQSRGCVCRLHPSVTNGSTAMTRAEAVGASLERRDYCRRQILRPYNNEFGKSVEGEGGEGHERLHQLRRAPAITIRFRQPAGMVAYLESERFLHPVMRQILQRAHVVIENADGDRQNPIGRLARAIHRRSIHGASVSSSDHWLDLDLNSFSATDAQNFFDKYYVPSNMVVTVVAT